MSDVGNGRIVCSFCGEEISADSKRCPYCGSVLAIDNSFKVEEVKTDSFGDNVSQVPDINSDIEKKSFDNSINIDNDANDFLYQEKSYDDRTERGLFDTKPNEQVTGETEKTVNSDNIVMNNTQAPQAPSPVHNVSGNPVRPQSYLGGNVPRLGADVKPSISNAMKVFITSICSLIPGIGQLVGVIIAIVFMNTEGDTDKRSFGLALLVNSIIIFVIMCISCCVLMIAFSESGM